MLTSGERLTLLRLAREAVVATVKGEALPEPAVEHLVTLAGAFVTLRSKGDLRGCIGHPEADQPLGQVVVRCASASATSDPRFSPLGADELGDLDIEISVIGAIEPVAVAADLEIGRHGVVVEDGWRRGLLLPQVALEWGWDAEEFLAQTCLKAGLRRDAWRTGALLFRFEAEVFGLSSGGSDLEGSRSCRAD
jgi:AmmeMemoRadiSam system protein A